MIVMVVAMRLDMRLRGQSLPLRFATFHKRNYAKGLCFAGFHHWNYIKRVCFAGFHRKNYIKGLRLATVRNRSYVRANDFAAIIPIIIINIFLILTFRLLLQLLFLLPLVS